MEKTFRRTRSGFFQRVVRVFFFFFCVCVCVRVTESIRALGLCFCELVCVCERFFYVVSVFCVSM